MVINGGDVWQQQQHNWTVCCAAHTAERVVRSRTNGTKQRSGERIENFVANSKNTIRNNKIQHVARMGIKTEHQSAD